MKTLKLVTIFLLVGYITLANAMSVDDQINAIQSASAEDRVSHVNEFKENVAAISAEDRASAIAQLRSSMQASHQSVNRGSKNVDANRIHQMQEVQDLQMKQQMQQKHAGSQISHEHSIVGDKVKNSHGSNHGNRP